MLAMRQILLGPMGAPTPPLPYDAEVEYLESTGTQWIDTGIYGRDGLWVSVSGIITDTTAYQRFFIGGSSAPYVMIGMARDLRLTFAACSSITTVDQSFDNQWHGYSVDTTSGSRAFYVDGNLLFQLEGTSATTNAPIALFKRTLATTSTAFSHCRISLFTIQDAQNGTMIADMYPIRFTNELGVSEGAMYDRVSGQLFRNQGTGAFTIGPDKS